MREVIKRIVDATSFIEFKALYGTSLICGFAEVFGQKVGIVANDGVLFSESSLKGVHFIQLCNQRKIPLLFLQNVTGFMVGKDYERKGIAKDGAKLVTAVSCSSVPKITIIVGGSFGAGNYGMAGRAFQPRFLFMWPQAKIGVMGAEQAASVLTQVRSDAATSKKSKAAPKEIAAYKAEIEGRYNQEASALFSTARLWDDGIINPKDTRLIVGLSLSITANGPVEETKYGTLRT